jgi:ADP-heptose:LPS heptosyltransferase
VTRKHFNLYAGTFLRQPRLATDTAFHRVRVQAIRKLRRRPVILFERHGGIGDVICTFPAVLGLRNRHPDAIFVYSVWKAFKSIVEMGQVADYVVEKDWSPEMPKVEYGDYDLCYQPWLEDERPVGRAHAHLVDDFAQTLQLSLACRQPKLYVPRSLAQSCSQRIGPMRRQAKYIIMIHVGPSWPVREWTVEGWSELARLLHQHFDCVVVQIGADSETGKGYVRSARIAGTEDWVGKLNLEETVAALQQTDLFIGIDSGLLHAAGAVGTRAVGLFGPVNPGLRMPVETPSVAVTSDVPCLGCHHRLPRLHYRQGCPHGIRCMAAISPQEVVDACEKLLRVGQPVA